jgi:peroxiredoxin
VAHTEVAVGARAPVVAAPDENGQLWHLSDALEHAAQVLVFYRGDW